MREQAKRTSVFGKEGDTVEFSTEGAGLCAGLVAFRVARINETKRSARPLAESLSSAKRRCVPRIIPPRTSSSV